MAKLKYNGGKTRILFGTIITIAVLIAIKIMSMNPINISYVVEYGSDSTELVNTTLLLENNDDFFPEEKQTVWITNQESRFLIDPTFFNSQKISFEISSRDLSTHLMIKGIAIESGTVGNEKRIGYIGADYLSNEIKVSGMDKEMRDDMIALTDISEDASIEFSTPVVNKIQKIVKRNNPIKIYLYFFVLFIYILFICRQLFLKKISIVTYLAGSIGIMVYIIFSLYSLNLPDNRTKDLRYVYDGEPIPHAIESGDEFVQSFTANNNNLNGVELETPLDSQNENMESVEDFENIEGYIAYIIHDKSANKDVYTKVVSANQLRTNGTVFLDFKTQQNSKNKEYSIHVKSFDFSGGNLILRNTQSISNDVELNGSVINSEKMQLLPSYRLVNYQLIVWLIVSVVTILLIFCVGYKFIKLSPKVLILIIYLVTLGFSWFQMDFYKNYLKGNPDEAAHVSYVGFLEKTDTKVLPDFKNMGIYNIVHSELDMEESLQVNYLGHPPLYYQILRFTKGVHTNVEGNVVINYDRMWNVSVSIVMLSLILIFYIGFTRIRKIPVLHMLFAGSVISVPMFLYNASGITNDSLTLLTIAVFFLGLLRFTEKKQNLLTYFLIAVGISATLLTKLTAGLIVVLTAIIFVSWYMLKEKSFKALNRKEFYLTLPIYLVAGSYFILLYKEFSTFQPSFFKMDPSGFYESGFYTNFMERRTMSYVEYVQYFSFNFFQTWTGIASHPPAMLLKRTPFYAVDQFGLVILWIMPLVLFFKNKISNIVEKRMLQFFFVSIVITVITQFSEASQAFFGRGYMGGFQSRYYLCIVPVLAYSLCKVIEAIYEYQSPDVQLKETSMFSNVISVKNGKVLALILSILLIVLLVYGGIIYFYLHFQSYQIF